MNQSDSTKRCCGNIDDPSCDHTPVWTRSTSVGEDHFCDMHARRERNFTEQPTTSLLWTRCYENFTVQHSLTDPVAITGSPRLKEELRELRKAFKPMDFRSGAPSSVREFIDAARAAGHDALGIANDPEAIETLETVKAARGEATIVEGEVPPAALYGASSPYNVDDDLFYQVKLVRKEPGNVEFLLTINGRVCGQMPFDNLIKAAVRIDPDHASGPEKQIQKLRKEAAEAKAAMYDWQARVMQLEERVKQYETAEAVPSDGD